MQNLTSYPEVVERRAADIQSCYLPPGPSWFSVERRGNAATLRITGEIGIYSQSVDNCVEQLGDAETVNVQICSNGGCCGSAFKIADALRSRRCEVEIFGSCFSAAVIIALAADKIRIERNARIMIHAPRQFVFGSPEEILLAGVQVERCNLRYRWQLSSRVRDDVLVQKWLSGPDFYFTAAEAIQLGLADEIFSAAPAVIEATPGAVPAPEQTSDEILFQDFLRWFGVLQVADKAKFFQQMSMWFNENVKSL